MKARDIRAIDASVATWTSFIAFILCLMEGSSVWIVGAAVYAALGVTSRWKFELRITEMEKEDA